MPSIPSYTSLPLSGFQAEHIKKVCNTCTFLFKTGKDYRMSIENTRVFPLGEISLFYMTICAMDIITSFAQLLHALKEQIQKRRSYLGLQKGAFSLKIEESLHF